MNRGNSYFNYLREPNAPKPRATRHDRQRRDENTLQQEKVPAVDEVAMDVDVVIRPNEIHDNDINIGNEEDILYTTLNIIIWKNCTNSTINLDEGQDDKEENNDHFHYDDVEDEENEIIDDAIENAIYVDLQQNADRILNELENEERLPIYQGYTLTKEESDL
ncbi:hypothetical protein TSAR_006701 [Trichomalopsis sarcophagae]|uniref:Uncharacterized protein n=1 Tax=Trichomalopsis sarcophagae TaxID=543379 RepID=A0A232EJA4_9HYME|nr:hypothetical protein TSAR_006701 [Trichomalopsis sarcophagae]